jgi:hypothetical protein
MDVNLILAPSEGGVDCEADMVARQDLTKLIKDKSSGLPRCFKQMRCFRTFECWTLDARNPRDPVADASIMNNLPKRICVLFEGAARVPEALITSAVITLSKSERIKQEPPEID